MDNLFAPLFVALIAFILLAVLVPRVALNIFNVVAIALSWIPFVMLAWVRFLLFDWWWIPKNPYSRWLETSGFLEQYLFLGKTLYEFNLAWRRDLSKYRDALRKGEKPLPRYRFSWRRLLHTVTG